MFHVVLYHPGVADAVVQGPFFVVPSRYQIPDHHDHTADHFPEIPGEGPQVSDLAPVGSHDLQAAGHLTRCGAEFPNEEGCQGDGHQHADDDLEEPKQPENLRILEAREREDRKNQHEVDDLNHDIVDDPRAQSDPKTPVNHGRREA